MFTMDECQKRFGNNKYSFYNYENTYNLLKVKRKKNIPTATILVKVTIKEETAAIAKLDNDSFTSYRCFALINSIIMRRIKTGYTYVIPISSTLSILSIPHYFQALYGSKSKGE